MEIQEHTLKGSGSLPLRKVTKEIIIHCSATAEDKSFTVEDIDRWHRQRGYCCCGYHYLIYLDGSVHRGRPEKTVGAHTTNHNSISVGICYIGGVARDGRTPMDTRTEAQKASLIQLVDDIKRRYPDATIHGHNEFASKACPSFSVREWFNEEYISRSGVFHKCILK